MALWKGARSRRVLAQSSAILVAATWLAPVVSFADTSCAGAACVAIGGTPPATVAVAQTYAFQPLVSAWGVTSPHFEIENAPPWAVFDPASGSLSGVPGGSSAGVYPGIRIAITDGAQRAELPAFTIWVGVVSSQPRLSWAPPTTGIDGLPLTNLAGYQIYGGTDPDYLSAFAALSDPGMTSFVVEGLPPGEYFFAVTALTAAGTESYFSPVVMTYIE